MILTIDLDLQTINEMLESEGIRVKKPSEMRTAMARRASDASLIYDDHRHIARQSSIVFSDGQSSLVGGDESQRNSFRSRFQSCCFKTTRSMQSLLHSCTSVRQRTLTAVSSGKKSNGNDSHRSETNEEGQQQTLPSTRDRKMTTEHSIRDRSLEMSLRNIYSRVKELEQFYHLNFYIIRKISKKIDKLLKAYYSDEKGIVTQDEKGASSNGVQPLATTQQITKDSVQKQFLGRSKSWKETKCGRYFCNEFVSSKRVIEELKDECIASYANKFRKSYTELATYELEYVKEKDHTNSSTKLYVGWKFGLIVCMVGVFC